LPLKSRNWFLDRELSPTATIDQRFLSRKSG
jgi:hypothetical protein